MEDSSLDLEILVSSPGVRLQIYGLVFGKEEMVCHTQLILQANDIQANMHLISIVQEGAQIQHRGTITIQPHFRQIESHLLEEHVMLGDNIRVRAQPVLQIASHDVRASHGAKIERLDEEKLLYMMSRGLTRVQSQKLILN
jgi:Fe-S cluster assembly scaffold protein SufB